MGFREGRDEFCGGMKRENRRGWFEGEMGGRKGEGGGVIFGWGDVGG